MTMTGLRWGVLVALFSVLGCDGEAAEKAATEKVQEQAEKAMTATKEAVKEKMAAAVEKAFDEAKETAEATAEAMQITKDNLKSEIDALAKELDAEL